MSVHSFKTQKRHTATPDILSIEVVDYKTIEELDNTEKYNWVQIGSNKYGRTMYCTKTKIRRTQTMGEFYGTSTVD